MVILIVNSLIRLYVVLLSLCFRVPWLAKIPICPHFMVSFADLLHDHLVNRLEMRQGDSGLRYSLASWPSSLFVSLVDLRDPTLLL